MNQVAAVLALGVLLTGLQSVPEKGDASTRHSVPKPRPVVQRALEKLKSEDGLARRDAVKKLGELGDAAAVAPLIDILRNDPERRVRDEAAEALGALGATEAVPALIQALKDKEWHVRYSAVLALKQLHAPEAAEAFYEALSDEDVRVSETAAYALEALAWKPATEAQTLWFAAAAQHWDELRRVYGEKRPGKVAASEYTCEAPLEYDIPIPIVLNARIDNETIIESRWISFSRDDTTRARLRCTSISWPASRWRLTLRLLDNSGTVLAKAEQEAVTSGLCISLPLREDPLFTFDLGPAAAVKDALRFTLTLERLPDPEPEARPASN